MTLTSWDPKSQNILPWQNCAYHPAAPGSSPKHAIYAFIIYSQICAIFVMWKEQNKQKEAGFGPFFKKNCRKIEATFLMDHLRCSVSYQLDIFAPSRYMHCPLVANWKVNSYSAKSLINNATRKLCLQLMASLTMAKSFSSFCPCWKKSEKQRKNWSILHLDSNSDHLSRRQARWPLNRQPRPINA